MPPGAHDGETSQSLPEYFITAEDISPTEHVDIQAAAQKWIDSSISKTANVPTDYAYDDFKDIYLYAYKQGLKGCTTFRFNPEAFQGVLVKRSNTTVKRTPPQTSSMRSKKATTENFEAARSACLRNSTHED
jgi:ribonucleoside-diphosphate reductase alpha chain